MTTTPHAAEGQTRSQKIFQAIQVTATLSTLIATFGLWAFNKATTPSVEVQALRIQLTEVSKELAATQLEAEGFKYQIEALKDEQGRLELRITSQEKR